MISALFNVGLALLPQGSTGHKYISAVRRAEKTGVYCWLAYIRPSVEGLGTSCHAFLRLFAIPPSKGPGYLAPVLEGGHGRSRLESNCSLHQLPWQFSQHPPNSPHPPRPNSISFPWSLDDMTILKNLLKFLPNWKTE